MITADQRHILLVVDRTQNVEAIAAMVDDVLADNPLATPLDIETAFRAAAAHSYLIADGDDFRIVIGMPAWRAALAEAGTSPDQNRAELGRK